MYIDVSLRFCRQNEDCINRCLATLNIQVEGFYPTKTKDKMFIYVLVPLQQFNTVIDQLLVFLLEEKIEYYSFML